MSSFDDIDEYINSLSDSELEYLNTCHSVVWYDRYHNLLRTFTEITDRVKDLLELAE